MKERRKQKREILFFYTRVFDNETGHIIGNLGDITSGGAMVISEHQIPINRRHSLKIELPKGMYGLDYLELKANSIWSKPDLDPNFYNTGFEFPGLQPDKAQIIHQIILDYSLPDRKKTA
jgi:hypothetical protein